MLVNNNRRPNCYIGGLSIWPSVKYKFVFMIVKSEKNYMMSSAADNAHI